MTVNVHELVNADASLVSRRCWTDPEVYALEKQYIFGKAWLFLGHESQIKNPGDFVQAYMCETPIILARDENGKICATINSCTHRGLPVCRADHGNAKRFVCPYHNWSYKVSGELVAIPRDALVLRGSEMFVLRVTADNTVEKISVDTGIGLGKLIEVIGDVFDGDRIVTRGAERLQPGQLVVISGGT